MPDPDGLAEHSSPDPAIKVLIIEDNRDGADSLRDVLAIYGYRVEVAYDGSDGLARALDFAPDVVICDVGLPDLDGYQVARALRSHRDLGRATLVALTGYGQPEDQRSAFEAGFNAHMTKPADLESLQRLLAEVARGAR